MLTATGEVLIGVIESRKLPVHFLNEELCLYVGIILCAKSDLHKY